MGLATVSAEDSQPISSDVTATLDETTNVCTFQLGVAEGDLGHYTWNGSGYDAPTGETASFTGGLDATGTPGNRHCVVTYTATDMTLDGIPGNPVAFTASQLMLDIGGGPTSMGTSLVADLPEVPVGGKSGTAYLTLSGAPDPLAVAGAYKATITFSIVAAD
jgi:hypothetical protein